MENNQHKDVLNFLQSLDNKITLINSNLQLITNLDIYQKELIIQNIQKRLKYLKFDYHNKKRSYSEYMNNFDQETTVPACLVKEVLYAFDMFKSNLSRQTLFDNIARTKEDVDSGDIYEDKYYIISIPAKGESKNKKVRDDNFFDFDDNSSKKKRKKNTDRNCSGCYYAYSLQNLIDTLFADIRSGKI
jgi:hypothetical protein